MVTYLYWAFVAALIFAAFFLLGRKIEQWKAAFITAAIILAIGTGAYYFHFQQIFVKRFGGVMTISMPEGQVHLAATWKDDNLWIENYDPETNTCHFREYSRGNLLQGHVKIEQCNPLLRQSSVQQLSNQPADQSGVTSSDTLTP